MPRERSGSSPYSAHARVVVDETGRGLDNGGMNILRALARPLLAAPFIHDGISALLKPADHVARASFVLPIAERIAPGAGLEEEDLRLTTRVLGAVSLTAGIALATGRAPRTSAALLAGIALPMALINAPVWRGEDREERIALASELARRLALVGGLAIASTDRVGEPSAAWRMSNRKVQRERIAAAREIERRRCAPRTDAAR